MKKSLADIFYFNRFNIDKQKGEISFDYSTSAGHTFTHQLGYVFPNDTDVSDIQASVFALGMAELAHFWKAILAPRIVVRAGALDNKQIIFWETLYRKGLGEFFYLNKIDFRNLIHLEAADSAPEIPPASVGGVRTQRALVPFGGGKDSLVTGELLKEKNKSFVWFELEPLPFSEKLMECSGQKESMRMIRDVEKNFAPIVELVRAGAPNGHVPITATYIFSALIVAQANDFSDVILSLERSADDGNVEYLGETINHQYSKSFEFEQAVGKYISTYITSNVRVFSLLRPLHEIQIVRKFTEYPQYFSHFISCNYGLKQCMWCGQCAKCAFMFAALSAFIEIEEVENIFKKNLFKDESLVPLYRELIGMSSIKPFDCVGTFIENHLALYLASEKYSARHERLPVVLEQLPVAEGAQYRYLLDEAGNQSRIPTEYRFL